MRNFRKKAIMDSSMEIKAPVMVNNKTETDMIPVDRG
jgi:hypothetical protein